MFENKKARFSKETRRKVFQEVEKLKLETSRKLKLAFII